MTTSRTDQHSPSNFDPAEYTYGGFVDQHHEEGFEDISDERVNSLPYWRHTVAGRYNGCDHCGHSGQRYLALFVHEPSQQVVVTGTQCATKLSLASRADLDAKAARKAHELRVKHADWLAADPRNAQLMAALDERRDTEHADREAMAAWNDRFEAVYDPRENNRREADAAAGPQPRPRVRTNTFLWDLGFKARRYGSLSERQVEAGLAAVARDAEFAARREAEAASVTAEFPGQDGKRTTVQGTVVSTKWQENDFGGSLKMLVRLEDGNKVWGTVPNSLDNVDKGTVVRFDAKFERSRDDEHFGFFSRPTKAQVLGQEGV